MGITELHYNEESFEKLRAFYILGSKIENTDDLLKCLSSSLITLELTGISVDNLTNTSFVKSVNLQELILTDLHGIRFDFNIFKQKMKLGYLDISQNNLKKINFTLLSNLIELNLEGNDLTEIDGLNSLIFPKLKRLSLLMNQFSCEYLEKLGPRLKREWPNLIFIGDDWHQKHDEKCIQNIVNQFISWGVLIIACIGFIIHWKVWQRNKNRNSKEDDSSEDIPYEMSTISYEISSRHETTEEPIYEEIQPPIESYDRLWFEFDPKPISKDTHYDNHYLVSNLKTIHKIK